MQMQKLVEIRGFKKNKLYSKILDFLRENSQNPSFSRI